MSLAVMNLYWLCKDLGKARPCQAACLPSMGLPTPAALTRSASLTLGSAPPAESPLQVQSAVGDQGCSQCAFHRGLLGPDPKAAGVCSAFHTFGTESQSRRQLGKNLLYRCDYGLDGFSLAITNLFPFFRQLLKELIAEVWQKENAMT